MKKTITLSIMLLMLMGLDSNAQKTTAGEKFGNTLNLGLGIGGYGGYYRYAGRTIPVFHINYEFNVARNFTLAPFISFSTVNNSYYWGDKDKNHPYKYYNYRSTVIPIGLKGTYYFDEILQANSMWDFYLAGSLGFAIFRSSWDRDYYGDKNYYRQGNQLFLDLHIGTELHLNNKVGLFLDLSTGVSTIGLAIH